MRYSWLIVVLVALGATDGLAQTNRRGGVLNPAAQEIGRAKFRDCLRQGTPMQGSSPESRDRRRAEIRRCMNWGGV